ncbi:MAG: DUF3078 domain-containing protein [Bacteroidota bacterium]
MKRLLMCCIAIYLVSANFTYAQTNEELQAQKEAKSVELADAEAQLKTLTDQVNGLKEDVAKLTDQLTPYPRVAKGLLSNIGLNFANFSDWYSKDQPNTSAVNIGISTVGFINAEYEKAFWRNRANLTLGWIRFDDKDNPDDEDGFQVAADAFNLSSLYGFKLTEKIAISTLGEYRTAVLDGRLNNPGYLDLGVGATWTPVPNLVIVAHPLNYNFVFSDDDVNFDSSLGAKIVADYNQKILEKIVWTSNLSIFSSYKSGDLSNWTWVNNFSTAVKGIGVGLDIGLRSNKQEALAEGLTDNPLQTYWILGLSYAIGK